MSSIVYLTLKIMSTFPTAISRTQLWYYSLQEFGVQTQIWKIFWTGVITSEVITVFCFSELFMTLPLCCSITPLLTSLTADKQMSTNHRSGIKMLIRCLLFLACAFMNLGYSKILTSCHVTEANFEATLMIMYL